MVATPYSPTRIPSFLAKRMFFNPDLRANASAEPLSTSWRKTKSALLDPCGPSKAATPQDCEVEPVGSPVQAKRIHEYDCYTVRLADRLQEVQ